MKTIKNMRNSASKEIVISAANDHYDALSQSISGLIDAESEIDLTLTIKLNKVSVELNMNESLIVINTLAVKRAALRGGAWSSAGKQVEKILMLTLFRLFDVDTMYYSAKSKGTESKKAKRGAKGDAEYQREIDFFLVNGDNSYKCEVKLMGAGNPESADAVIARDSDIFIADKLSENNIKQLESLGTHWVELRSDEGYKRFTKILNHYEIPHNEIVVDLDAKINTIIDELVTTDSSILEVETKVEEIPPVYEESFESDEQLKIMLD